jgi:predicted secreted acid phosphatase
MVDMVILATATVFLIFIIGVAFGQRVEAKSWERQARYDTPKHRHGRFWYVLTESQYVEWESHARHAYNRGGLSKNQAVSEYDM